MKNFSLLLLVAAAGVLCAVAPVAAEDFFLAQLSPAEVASEDIIESSGATGIVNLEVVPSLNGTDLYFRIDLQGFGIEGLSDDERTITSAGLFLGSRNVEGVEVLVLYDGEEVPPAADAFTLTEGIVNLDSELPAEVSVEALLEALNAEGAYVQVSTSTYPSGELRGQVTLTDTFAPLLASSST